jgi:hypothetical protein
MDEVAIYATSLSRLLRWSRRPLRIAEAVVRSATYVLNGSHSLFPPSLSGWGGNRSSPKDLCGLDSGLHLRIWIRHHLSVLYDRADAAFGLCAGYLGRGQGRHPVPDRLASRHVRLHGRRYFWIFRDLLGTEQKVNTPEFWFTMQAAMIFGFITSYPVNWWLLKAA